MKFPEPPQQRIPWMSKRDRELILTLLMLKPYRMRVVEFGAGWSTAFFSQYSGPWHTTEHDEEWCAKIRNHLPNNVSVYHAPKESMPYVQYALADAMVPGYRPIDLVLIDGRRREECAEEVLKLGGDAVWMTLMHDARRGSAAMRKFPFHYKIGDDMYLGMFEEPRFYTVLKDFEARDVDALSVPWDKSHIGQPGFTPVPNGHTFA